MRYGSGAEPLHWCLACLRLLDQARDLSQRCLEADTGRAYDEPAVGVYRRACHLVVDGNLDGDRLAGQHRLVDRGRAFDDDAVGGDLLTRTDDEDQLHDELRQST